VFVVFTGFSAVTAREGHTGQMRLRARRRRRLSVAGELLTLQILLLVVVLAAAGTASVLMASAREDEAATEAVTRVATEIGSDPWVAQQALTADPTQTLQPFAEQVRRATGTDFVVIMAPDRTRWTHADTSQIGRPFLGTIAPALAGQIFTETFTGTLGPSIRAVAPVRNQAGVTVALVAVGVTTQAIHTQLMEQLPFLIGGFVLLLLIAWAGAALVSRRLRRQTSGLDRDALAQLYASHGAVLHSIREGLLVIDDRRAVSLINDEAMRLLGLGQDVVGTHVDELPLPATLLDLFRTGVDALDEMHLAQDRVLVVNQSTATFHGRTYGTVATLRDRTEMEALTGELDTVRAFAESLRSQAHEASNKLHTMVALVETGRYDTAVEYATRELKLSQRLTDRMVGAVHEPVLAALLLGKTAQAAERGVELTITEDSQAPASAVPVSDLITVVGNLIDNAIDASAEGDLAGRRAVTVALVPEDGDLVIEISDSGPGLPSELRESAFTRGWSTKVVTTPGGRGLGLALVNQVVRRHRGSIEVFAGPQGGAHFSVRLPMIAAAQEASAQTTADAQAADASELAAR
jgi:two-component system, CitB family, sensor kinase